MIDDDEFDGFTAATCPHCSTTMRFRWSSRDPYYACDECGVSLLSA